MEKQKILTYTNWQIFGLVLLRVSIGWHFLYERIIKVTNPNWTAAPFLQASQGPLASLFKSITANPGTLEVINFCNQWGLILIGLSLMIGLLSRLACLGGMALLFLYYISNPPFIGLDLTAGVEGNYLIVNKNLIELFALFVLFLLPTDMLIGLGRLLPWQKQEHKKR